MFKNFFGTTRKRTTSRRCVNKRTTKSKSVKSNTTKLKKTYKNGFLVKVTNPKGKRANVQITDSMWREKGKRKMGLLASYDKKPYRRISKLNGSMESNAVKYAKKGHREVIIRD